MNLRDFFFITGCVLTLLSGCSNRPVGSLPSYGFEEIAKDSALIAQGKKGLEKLFQVKFSKEETQKESSDKIENGDVLGVVIFNPFFHPWIECIRKMSHDNQLVVVDGLFHLPNFGILSAKGKTIHELKQEIAQLIQREFPDSACVLEIKDRYLKRVEISGIVNQSVPLLDKNKTLYQLLSTFPTPREISFFNSYVKRRGKVLSNDLEKLMIDHDLSEDLLLEEGDSIFLADGRNAKIVVLGEVKKEGIVQLDKSTISIKEVIARSGGIDRSADRTFIQVIRGGMKNPKVYTLHYQHILKAPNESILLMQGDVLYVAATPIAEWNRLINQILPSITTYEFFHRGIQGVIIP
jgi:polysaccharide export outer membrane protein